MSTPSASTARPLRVAVLEAGDDGLDWSGTFSPGEPVEILPCRSHAELVSSTADLAIVCAPPALAAGIASELAAQPDPIPLAILTGAACRQHPHARLVHALVRAKREWQAAFDALQEPLAILDREGRVMRANLSFARALGRSIREVLGTPTSELLGRAESGEDPVAASLVDNAPRTAEVVYGRLPVPHQVSVSPLPEDDGERAGLVLLLKDLSEQKEQQERLFMAARLADVGQLAAGVAHEINTPLASIALRAESLLRTTREMSLPEHPAAGNFRRYLQTIQDEAFRCKRIIKALLEFSARTRPEKKPVDLNRLVEAAATLVEHQLRIKGVRLERQLAAEPPVLSADEGQLRQAILALLTNALDATSAGGRIRVATERLAGGLARLVVEDDGVGIPREIQDKVFAPFFTTKPFGQGTGLGLSICHGIVGAHGGQITADSEVGKGTRMEITLPGVQPVEKERAS